MWIRQVAAESGVQIVAGGLMQFVGLTFSHDGNFIYFTAVAVDHPETGYVASSKAAEPAAIANP